MARHELDVLPDWTPGTVAILSTAAGHPHAIPVSTGVRAGDRRIVLALALRRESLANLREEPRCALTILAEGDVAVTALGRATIVEEPLSISDTVVAVAAVAIDVDSIQDHNQSRFEIEAGVRWHWTDGEAEARDGEIRRALAALSNPARPGPRGASDKR